MQRGNQNFPGKGKSLRPTAIKPPVLSSSGNASEAQQLDDR